MIYTPLVTKVLNFIYNAHAGATDRGGAPYVFHPFTVAQEMEEEDAVILSLLHDVVEDTCFTFDDIRSLGVSENVINSLKIMTHDPNIPYFDYIREIKKNPLARIIKLADLRHNSNLSRLNDVTDNDMTRVEKYSQAINILISP